MTYETIFGIVGQTIKNWLWEEVLDPVADAVDEVKGEAAVAAGGFKEDARWIKYRAEAEQRRGNWARAFIGSAVATGIEGTVTLMEGVAGTAQMVVDEGVDAAYNTSGMSSPLIVKGAVATINGAGEVASKIVGGTTDLGHAVVSGAVAGGAAVFKGDVVEATSNLLKAAGGLVMLLGMAKGMMSGVKGTFARLRKFNGMGGGMAPRLITAGAGGGSGTFGMAGAVSATGECGALGGGIASASPVFAMSGQSPVSDGHLSDQVETFGTNPADSITRAIDNFEAVLEELRKPNQGPIIKYSNTAKAYTCGDALAKVLEEFPEFITGKHRARIIDIAARVGSEKLQMAVQDWLRPK